MEKQTSAIVLSPNLVLCCGKDGQMRLFGDFYEVKNLPKTFLFSILIHFSSEVLKYYTSILVLFKL